MQRLVLVKRCALNALLVAIAFQDARFFRKLICVREIPPIDSVEATKCIFSRQRLVIWSPENRHHEVCYADLVEDV